jgi:curli biogenesis system outer membrane secretion channel CsgG
LGVAAITPTESLKVSTEKAGKGLLLKRVIDSLDGRLLNSFNATRKFQLVAASDLAEIIKKQDLAQSGNFDGGDKSLAQQFKLAGTKYYVITTIDDFEDSSEKMAFKQSKTIGIRRKVRISAVAKVFDSTTGRLLESTIASAELKEDRTDLAEAQRNAELTDALLVDAARETAEMVALKVVDAVFPIKVVAKRDKQITINRGEGGGVKVGQVWEVYVLGKELVDPDTKASLGAEEVKVGRARIISVRQSTSAAELLEDLGIEAGAVLRQPESKG